MAEKESDTDAARLIGMNPNTLESKRSPKKEAPIKKDVIDRLKDFLEKQKKNEMEIKQAIQEFNEQPGDLKTSPQRKKLFERFPLKTE